MPLLLPPGSLERAARLAGLNVVVLPGAGTRRSGGEFGLGVTEGILCHHTGSPDVLGDAANDEAYAGWMAWEGRDDLDPPLCNLALSVECTVYVCAYGNANHGGTMRAAGPFGPGDANERLVGIEAMNSGTQGWESVGKMADGTPITQRDAYAALCAGICLEFDWDPDVVLGHLETSTTGKWDPGGLGMYEHRTNVARWIKIILDKEAGTIMADQADRIIEAVEKSTARIVERIGGAEGRERDRDRRQHVVAMERLEALQEQADASEKEDKTEAQLRSRIRRLRAEAAAAAEPVDAADGLS